MSVEVAGSGREGARTKSDGSGDGRERNKANDLGIIFSSFIGASLERATRRKAHTLKGVWRLLLEIAAKDNFARSSPKRPIVISQIGSRKAPDERTRTRRAPEASAMLTENNREPHPSRSLRHGLGGGARAPDGRQTSARPGDDFRRARSKQTRRLDSLEASGARDKKPLLNELVDLGRCRPEETSGVSRLQFQRWGKKSSHRIKIHDRARPIEVSAS